MWHYIPSNRNMLYDDLVRPLSRQIKPASKSGAISLKLLMEYLEVEEVMISKTAKRLFNISDREAKAHDARFDVAALYMMLPQLVAIDKNLRREGVV